MIAVPCPRLSAPLRRSHPVRLRWLGTAVAVGLAGLALVPRGAESWPGPAALPPGVVAGCRVVEVIDGDTLTLVCPGRGRERARLTGFDAPELHGPRCRAERRAALRARRELAALVAGGAELGIVRQGRDRYGRALVALTAGGRPVAEGMIAAGAARAYDGGRRNGWCSETPGRAT